MRFGKRILFGCLFITILTISVPLYAQQLEFSLFDSYGRQVTAEDYAGVPIFLEFGACW